MEQLKYIAYLIKKFISQLVLRKLIFKRSFIQNPPPVVKVNDIDKSNELKKAIKEAIKFPNPSPTSPSGASLTTPNQKGVSIPNFIFFD